MYTLPQICKETLQKYEIIGVKHNKNVYQGHMKGMQMVTPTQKHGKLVGLTQ